MTKHEQSLGGSFATLLRRLRRILALEDFEEATRHNLPRTPDPIRLNLGLQEPGGAAGVLVQQSMVEHCFRGDVVCESYNCLNFCNVILK